MRKVVGNLLIWAMKHGWSQILKAASACKKEISE